MSRLVLLSVALWLAVPVGVGLAAAPAGAESPAPLSLAEAVRLALDRNHELSASGHAREAADWSYRRALAQLLPSVQLEWNYTQLDGETVARANAMGREIVMVLPDSTGALQPLRIEIPQTVFRHGYQTSINAQLLLLHPALWNGVALADAARSLAGVEHDVTTRRTAHETLRAFVTLLRLRSLAALQERHLQQAQDNSALADRLYSVGRYAEADVLRWRVEEARQSGLLQELHSSLAVATLTLENLIAAPPGAVVPDTTLPGRLRGEIERFRAMPEEAWDLFLTQPLDGVIAANPERAAIERSVRLAELQHRQSLAAFLPSLTVAGSYGWQNNETLGLDGDRAWSVGAALNVPIFTGFSNYAQHQTTRLDLLAARERAQSAGQGLMLAAQASRSAIRNQVEQLRLADAGLASARRGVEIQRTAFALGRLSNLEWIDANLALQGAEQSYTSAYYDLVLAIADHQASRGEILTLVED